MKAKDIKFRRERVDEFTVVHWFDAGTKHLPRCYASKHYCYDLYDESGKILNHDERNMRTLTDVKKYIAGYDEAFEKRAEAEAKLKADIEAEYAAKRAEEYALTALWVSPVAETPVVAAGDRVQVQMSRQNKPNRVGEGFLEVCAPREAEVVNVTHVTAEEFDTACESLYSNFKQEWLLQGDDGEYIGGSVSDDPRLDGYSGDEVIRDPKLLEIYRQTYRELVNAIVAPNRRVLFVNAEGYPYPRYIGKLAF